MGAGTIVLQHQSEAGLLEQLSTGCRDSTLSLLLLRGGPAVTLLCCGQGEHEVLRPAYVQPLGCQSHCSACSKSHPPAHVGAPQHPFRCYPPMTGMGVNAGLTLGLAQECAMSLGDGGLAPWLDPGSAAMLCPAVGAASPPGALSSPERDGKSGPNPPLEPLSQDNFCCPHALRISLALGFAVWIRADAVAFCALLHHYHGSICINTTAPSPPLLQTHQHCYHRPVCLLLPVEIPQLVPAQLHAVGCSVGQAVGVGELLQQMVGGAGSWHYAQ